MLFALLAVAQLLVATTSQAQPISRSSPYIPNHYIVVLKDSVDHPSDVAREQLRPFGGDRRFVYRHALTGYSATLPSDKAVDAIRDDPRVVSIGPDVLGGAASQFVPTGVSRIFAASNNALVINEKDDVRVDADVAVLDSGIDYLHPDLNVVSRTDCSNGATKAGECIDSSGMDGNGHGTHVAGIIGAIDNGYGVPGVAPGARLWSVKVLDSFLDGSLSEYIAGIDWVTGHASDIEVANASLRYFGHTSNAQFNASMAASIEAGVVHVAAAGNENESVKYVPGNNPEVITVSAIADYDGKAGGTGGYNCTGYGKDDYKATFSNFGPLVDIAAPGVCIYSTVPGNNYSLSSGTSMAAPHVAGAAALLASASNPNSKADVNKIRDTLVQAGNSGWTDTSPDGIKEPLLDVSNEEKFVLVPMYSLTDSVGGGPPSHVFNVFGQLPEDRPVSGDWNGDGVDTVGFFRPSTGYFYLRNSNSPGPADLVFKYWYGISLPTSSLPLAGDWNGDGIDTIGVYYPGNGYFYLRNSNSAGGANYQFPFGNGAGDLPVDGDWDNNGTDTIGVYRLSNGAFYLRNSNSSGSADYAFGYGNSYDDRPVAGDWDENGFTSVGVYRQSTGTWYLDNELPGNQPISYVFSYGVTGLTTPVAGDWNASGTDTAGAVRKHQ